MANLPGVAPKSLKTGILQFETPLSCWKECLACSFRIKDLQNTCWTECLACSFCRPPIFYGNRLKAAEWLCISTFCCPHSVANDLPVCRESDSGESHRAPHLCGVLTSRGVFCQAVAPCRRSLPDVVLPSPIVFVASPPNYPRSLNQPRRRSGTYGTMAIQRSSSRKSR
jgi:hypothetical protein